MIQYVLILLVRNQALLADPKGKYVTETLMTRAEERSSVFSPDGMIESEYERFEKRFMLTKDDTLVRSLFHSSAKIVPIYMPLKIHDKKSFTQHLPTRQPPLTSL